MWIALWLCGWCVINKTSRGELRLTAVAISDNKQDTLLLSCISKRVYLGLASSAVTFNRQGGIACPPDVKRWVCVLCVLVLAVLWWCFLTGQGCAHSRLH